MNSQYKYDIGLIGIYTVENFGGALTNYALYRTVKTLGYSTLMIERPNNSKHKPGDLSNIYIESPYPPSEKAKIYPTKKAMSELNHICDKFVVGSDQLFNSFLFNNYSRWISLDWVYDYKQKIAYAASFGHDDYSGSEEEIAEFAYYLHRYDSFSVREKSGVDLANKYFNIDATWVLDPVFLCKKEDYVKLAEKSLKQNKGHVFSYILDLDDEKYKILKYVSEHLNKPFELYSEFERFCPPDWYVKYNVTKGKIEDRLASLINSDFIVTDSFHGLCLAIIFNKPVLSIMNSKRGSARFDTILNLFDMKQHIVYDLKTLEKNNKLLEPIDYTTINDIIDKEKSRCIQWLCEQIETKNKKQSSIYDIMYKQLLYLNKELENLNNEIKKLKENDTELLSQLGLKNIVNCADIYSFLNFLIKCREPYYICISVKDTPGFALNNEIEKLLHELGLTVSFTDRHWCGYVSLLSNDELIFEELSAVDNPCNYAKIIDSHEIKINSAPLHAGNYSSIMIDKIDYSCNMRGFNFVVIDKITMQIIDSVCFDTLKPPIVMKRRSIPSMEK